MNNYEQQRLFEVEPVDNLLFKLGEFIFDTAELFQEKELSAQRLYEVNGYIDEVTAEII